MKCPYCSSNETRVLDKRAADDLDSNKRRRECSKCGKRFTTYERTEVTDFVITKKDGRREPFKREKLKRGILKACEKRPISYKIIERTLDEVEDELRSMNQIEIDSKIVGNIVMKKLKDIDAVAYIRFASYYKSFTDLESFEQELKKLKVVDTDIKDSTDVLLQVTTGEETVSDWNKEKIGEALVREANLSEEDAKEVAASVEKKVFSSGIKTISVSLIRELVDNELFIRGFNKKLSKQGILGMPTFNITELIFSKSNENSNVAYNNPEAVNLSIAENALKQYALREIFSRDVAEAHSKAAIHLHDLGYPIRCYCSAHSLDYIKKYGLHLLNLSTVSKPAKHASTLTGHLNTFLASMQAYYAGALGISYLNIFYAPLLVGMDYERLKQEAQYLIFSCSQNAFSRGGQTLFIDFNIHLGIPNYMKNVPAIGPGGKYMLKKGETIEYLDDVPRDENDDLIQPNEGRILTYSDFEKETQAFAKAMLDVWGKGDAQGKPFPFPKCNLHVNQEVFDDPKQAELFKHACKIASGNGAPYFIFDREETTLSMCCRLRTTITDQYILKHPESMRFCGFQNVSINLPQAVYKAGKGNIDNAVEELNKIMDIAMKAHLQKKEFIGKIMSQPQTPLWQVGMPAADGRPYIDLEKATYIIGLVGLNEAVKFLTDKSLHESDEAYKTGLKLISAMYLKAKELEKQTGLKVTLEETPAESAAFRLAKVDLKLFPESKNYVKGNQKTGEIYYTNSIHFIPDAPIDITERIEKQAKFNTLIESGAITHVFLGEQRPDPMSVFQLVKGTWENTPSSQIVISPEFTVCNDCHQVSPGFTL